MPSGTGTLQHVEIGCGVAAFDSGLVKSLLNSAIDRLRPMGRAAAHEPAGPAPIIDAREEMPL